MQALKNLIHFSLNSIRREKIIKIHFRNQRFIMRLYIYWASGEVILIKTIHSSTYYYHYYKLNRNIGNQLRFSLTYEFSVCTIPLIFSLTFDYNSCFFSLIYDFNRSIFCCMNLFKIHSNKSKSKSITVDKLTYTVIASKLMKWTTIVESTVLSGEITTEWNLIINPAILFLLINNVRCWKETCRNAE